MATSIGYGHALSQTSYSAGATLAAKIQTYMFNFVGKEQSAAICREDRPGAQRGTTIKVRFADVNYDEAPKTRGEPILGNESGTTFREDSLDMRYFNFTDAIECDAVDQENVSFAIKENGINRMSTQWAYNMDRSWIYQGTGYTVVNTANDYGLSGGNIVTAPDTAHHTFTAGSTDAAVAADTTAILTTEVIADAVMKLSSRSYSTYPAAPCDTPWGPRYVAVVGKVGFNQLKWSTPSTTYYDLATADLKGGGAWLGNSLISGEGMIVDNTVILCSDFMPQGVTAAAAQANCQRAMVFGAGGWDLTFGEKFGSGDHLGYSEHRVHDSLSMKLSTVWGLKRRIVDSQSWAVHVISHYSTV